MKVTREQLGSLEAYLRDVAPAMMSLLTSDSVLNRGSQSRQESSREQAKGCVLHSPPDKGLKEDTTGMSKVMRKRFLVSFGHSPEIWM